ncbi:DEAD-box ATP-dependent RNA helicase 57-like isoform X1 [Gossypium australe]|uniref:RNA helicase n=1 Tax=Gossypium australe TaxID=47621 RepID=A0A5B6VRY4_9ROSI|nr:DEAD-box ATP-dependent RNA helicase 57-like isoform X1 [Gossypium australe]
MEKAASFLFAGTSFNKKKYADEIAWFKEKKETENEVDYLSSFERVNPGSEEVTVSTKKRKRKQAASEAVEGFNVFKSSKKALVISQENKTDEGENLSKEKKKMNLKLEADSILRKQYNIHVSGNNVASPLKSFADLSSVYIWIFAIVSHKLKIEMMYCRCLCKGRECFACAPTGSGKTLAFVSPMLMKLKHASTEGVRAVILCPTRELAAQTTRECKKLAEGNKFYIKLLTKKLIRSADLTKLRCDILISTPLRLSSAIKKRKLDLSRVEYLVLDESDKLFELGLIKQIDSVVKACSNPSIIRSLFSATLPDSVEELARTIMHDAVRVIIGRKNTASESVNQKLVFAGTEEGKLLALRQSFQERLNPPVLIFVQSKERAKELYEELKFDNIRVGVIHSDLSETQRENVVNDFRAGKTWVLIATDVIARGMDFKGVNCVINYDFPDSAAAYIHRIGRSGRAGRTGEAITFYTEDDVPFLRNIANVMAASGCEVPSWIMALRKLRWKRHRPKRESILTIPDVPEE